MANPKLNIVTPRGTLYQIHLANGKITCGIRWRKDFGASATNNFNKAQAFVDSEVVRFCSARVPFQSGMLQKSGTLGTVIGSGEVVYLAPYARKQYKTRGSRAYDANRGGQWFERGKAVERERILRGAAKIAGET